MIDSHAHLYDSRFNNDIDEVITRAKEKGVTKFIIPSVDRKSYNGVMGVCNKFPNVCFPCIGVHPTSLNGGDLEAELKFVEEKLTLPNTFKAVGEIGIDCYWTNDFIENQRYAFEHQIKLALQYKLPIIIHARDSFHEIFPILDRLHTPALHGVFHSFAGTLNDYHKIKSYGTFKVGISGPITFKNNTSADTVKQIAVEDILLETDAPYLTPHPFRGKRNESAYMYYTAQKIAEIKEISLAQLDEITTNNTVSLFKL